MITVVVILILAGISIVMLTGDNSIIKNAQRAKIETKVSATMEQIKLAIVGAIDRNGNFDVEILKKELEKLGVSYKDIGEDLLIEIPKGKEIIVSKGTGEIKEGIHRVFYNYNGGEETGEVPSDDKEYKEGENIKIKFTPITEKEGFEFLGWATNEEATSAEYTENGINTVKMEKRSITLYAVWKGIPHTISYDANKGTGDVPIDGNTYIKRDNVEVSFEPKPTRAGYTFVGWSEDKKSESAEYTEDGIKTIEMPAKDVKLYAIWLANKDTAYTVEHYQMNTSGVYTSEPIGINVYKDGTTDARVTVADLKENYTGFTYNKGQVDGVDATTTTVLGDGSRVIKLYYTRNSYTISYNLNGGTGNVPTSHAQAYETNATVKFDRLPTKTEGVFLGWSENSNATTPTYSASGTKNITVGANNVTLYAIWHNHVNSCYSTACRGSFTQTNSSETYYTCSHTHTGSSSSGGGCYNVETGTRRCDGKFKVDYSTWRDVYTKCDIECRGISGQVTQYLAVTTCGHRSAWMHSICMGDSFRNIICGREIKTWGLGCGKTERY